MKSVWDVLVMVMWLWWFCVLYFQRDIWWADFSDHKSLKTFKLRNALKKISSKFKINHANNDWTKMFDMIRISKKLLKPIETVCLFINSMSYISSVLYIIQLQYGLLYIDITIHLSFNLIQNVYNRPPLSFGFNNPSVRAL